jgi:hypothetical protein
MRLGRFFCRLGRHHHAYVRAHWYGHLVGRCRRCGRVRLPAAR